MTKVLPSSHHIATRTACRGINHVLKAEPWAMTQLAAHADKVILLRLPVGVMCVEITHDGLLAALTEIDQASLELDISADALSALAGSSGSVREQAIKAVKITGDADLAQLIGRLAGQVRWEYEEDLSRLIGDAPANFAVQQGKKVMSAGKSAAKDFVENIVEYLSEERKVLLNKRDFLVRRQELIALRDAVERMEKRIQLLEQRAN